MSSRPELIKARREKAKFAKFAFPARKPMPHSILMTFEEYDYQTYISSITKSGKQNPNLGFVPDIKSRAEISNTSTVELPFPRQLTDTNNIRVQSFERDFMYERAASYIAGMAEGGLGETSGKILGALESGLKGVRAGSKDFFEAPLTAIKDALSGIEGISTEKAAAMAGYLARNIIGGDLSRTISAVTNRAVNPQETLSFTGVDLRNFQFSWDLYPSNKDDTDEIERIVKFLKARSLPEVEDGGSEQFLGRAFLKYPDIVSLNLIGVDESKFTRFKRCMISNVTIDYGAGGQVSIIKGGVPAAVTLTISFSEVQIQTRDDYEVTKEPPPPGVTIHRA